MSKNKNINKNKSHSKTVVIATRKNCQASGTGLSHYILMDQKTTGSKSK